MIDDRTVPPNLKYVNCKTVTWVTRDGTSKTHYISESPDRVTLCGLTIPGNPKTSNGIFCQHCLKSAKTLNAARRFKASLH